MKWLLALAICIGVVSEADAAVSYRAGWAPRHLTTRSPMGLDIVPDSVLRFLWQRWFDYRTVGVGNKKLRMRPCSSCWAYPAEDETK